MSQLTADQTAGYGADNGRGVVLDIVTGDKGLRLTFMLINRRGGVPDYRFYR
jgi:hypothetical protein